MEIRKKKTKLPAFIALVCSLIRFGLFALPHSQYDRLSSMVPLNGNHQGETIDWGTVIPGVLSIFAILRNSLVLIVSLSSLFLSQPYSLKRWNIFLLILYFLDVGCEAGAILYSCNLKVDGVSFIRFGNYIALVFLLLCFIAFCIIFYPCIIVPDCELKKRLDSIKLPEEKTALSEKEKASIEREATIDAWIRQGKRSKEKGEKRKDAIRKK